MPDPGCAIWLVITTGADVMDKIFS